MCGRYILQLTSFEISAEVGIDPRSEFSANTNVAPTSSVPIAFSEAKKTVIDNVDWGYTPEWVSGPKLLINLKSETILEKAFARKAVTHGRCIFLATGFFEWATIKEKGKIPILFEPREKRVFGLAGIKFANSKGKDQALILTTSANAVVSQFHDRMPVIIEREGWEDWLAEGDAASKVNSFCKPADDNLLRPWEVDKQFNNARYKGQIVRNEMSE